MNSFAITFLLLLFTIVNGIEVTLHGFVYVPSVFHETLADRANAYLKAKGLDVTLKTNFESPFTSSGNPVHVAGFIEESVLKKAYDLYVTDTVYTGRFSEHFEDLSKYVDPNVIDLYKDGTATKTCYVDTKLAGLPLMVDYGGMYSNMKLLNKYNRTIPETWDELIDTTNYIYNLESPTNPELRKFLGHFPDTENGLVTILQYIHSFRDSPTDKFPEYTSDNAVAALEKMKEIKNKASTPDDFNTPDIDILKSLNMGNFIFLLYWCTGQQYEGQEYVFSQLPGKKKGISASCVGGSNISMNKYLSEEKKKAAGEVLNFINSFEQQKFGIINANLISAIHSTYSDPEICQKIDCIKFSTMQSIVRPSSSAINYEQYSHQFRDLVRGYLYDQNSKTAKEVLTEVEDLRKIHNVEINSMAGIVILAITFVVILISCVSYVYITAKRFKQQFVFLPYFYWCIFILGILLTAFYPVSGVNKLTNYNCLIRPFLLSIGFDMAFVPFLLKMITIFPTKNGFSKLVKDHFTLMFVFCLIVNVGLNIAWYLVDPLVVNKFMVTSGKNFQFCGTTNSIGNYIKYVMFGCKIVILLVMSVLSFAEWNLIAFKSDIRTITTTIYNNLVIIITFIIVEKINIDDRYLYYILRAGLVLIYCISNILIIIGMKYYQISFKKEEAYPDIRSFSKNSSTNASRNTNYYQSMNQSMNMNKSQNKTNLFNMHYQTGAAPPAAASKAYPTLFSNSINSMQNSTNGNNLFKNSNSSSNYSSDNGMKNSKNSNNSGNYYNYNTSNNTYNNMTSPVSPISPTARSFNSFNNSSVTYNNSFNNPSYNNSFNHGNNMNMNNFNNSNNLNSRNGNSNNLNSRNGYNSNYQY